MKCDEFNIFHQNFKPTCAMALIFALMFSCENLAGLNINKVCDFVINVKNKTFISCVFNGFKCI